MVIEEGRGRFKNKIFFSTSTNSVFFFSDFKFLSRSVVSNFQFHRPYSCSLRTATVLNLFGEKVDQLILLSSLHTALSHWPGVEMTHYCVAESTMLAGMPEYNDSKWLDYFVLTLYNIFVNL